MSICFNNSASRIPVMWSRCYALTNSNYLKFDYRGQHITYSGWSFLIKLSCSNTNIATPLPRFCPKPPILGDEVLKIHANINSNPITALNARRSPKFPRQTGNLGRGTRWWRQILHRKWKYSRFAHAQCKICNITFITYYRNIRSVVVDLLWGRYHVSQNVFLAIIIIIIIIIIIPAKAREYVFTGVGLCVCVSVYVSVCDHHNWKDCGRICTTFYGKVPKGKGKTKFVFRYDR